MSADQQSEWPRGGPFLVAGGAAVLLGAAIDRVLYDLTSRSNDLTGLFMFAAVKRTLATAGGVLLAFGVGLEIIRRHSSS